jgi:type IV pilus assembly protein PilN
MLDKFKLKNAKFSFFSKSKIQGQISNKHEGNSFSGLSKKFSELFSSKISKINATTEEVVGIDITHGAIHVAQVSKKSDERWVLDKFSYRFLDSSKIKENLLETPDYLVSEINLALSNAKITAKNVALSIPVTSAIIRVVTSPLMSEEELKNAVETNSLWENLIQLSDNLNDYSIFHEVINRDSTKNLMDILFVASKLSDVNAWSALFKKAGLNPIIMDVRCFTLKNAVDERSKMRMLTEENKGSEVQSAILEFGLEDNYLIIIHNNIPIITDIFLRPQEKNILTSTSENNISQEVEDLLRRYSLQVKQAIADYETKFQTKISDIKIITSLKNYEFFLKLFKNNILNIGVNLLDPISEVIIPEYNKEKIDIKNKSPFTSAIGLAYRKLDVFGYYKFVTAVKNINLLPNRDIIRQQAKFKFLSRFALKNFAVGLVIFYITLVLISFGRVYYNDNRLKDFSAIEAEFIKINTPYSVLNKQLTQIKQAAQIGQSLQSNKNTSYELLVQISNSTQPRVRFSKIEYDGAQTVKIEGTAFSDQDILNFVAKLKTQKGILDATLSSVSVVQQQQQQGISTIPSKSFVVVCQSKGA